MCQTFCHSLGAPITRIFLPAYVAGFHEGFAGYLCRGQQPVGMCGILGGSVHA